MKIISLLIRFYVFICSENCGRQAGKKEPGATKETRREGERGKDEEEVSPTFWIPLTLK